MSRISLFALQLLVAVVALALWQFLSTVPVFGKIWLPPFFFSNPVDVFAQIAKWFASGVIRLRSFRGRPACQRSSAPRP